METKLEIYNFLRHTRHENTSDRITSMACSSRQKVTLQTEKKMERKLNFKFREGGRYNKAINNQQLEHVPRASFIPK